MKVLFDLYCSTTIRPKFMKDSVNRIRTPFSTRQKDPLSTTLPRPSGTKCAAYQALSSEQKKNAYARFYRALIAHWVGIENHWLSRTGIYQTSKECKDYLTKIMREWAVNQDRDLDFQLDVVEVADFVWVLLPHTVFAGPKTLLEWFGSGSDPSRPNGQTGLETYLTRRVGPMPGSPQGLLRDTQWVQMLSDGLYQDVLQFLRPTHIIEILLLMHWNPSNTWKLDRRGYLRRLGFLDTTHGCLAPGAAITDLHPADSTLSTLLLEEDPAGSLMLMGCMIRREQIQEERKTRPGPPFTHSDMVYIESACNFKFTEYRQERWVRDMRGQILFREETQRQLFDRFIDVPDLVAWPDDYEDCCSDAFDDYMPPYVHVSQQDPYAELYSDYLAELDQSSIRPYSIYDGP